VSPAQLDADGAASDDASMRLALEAAHAAAARGDVPVGAVALRDGLVLATAGNAREELADPTAHAEILVLRAAAAVLGRWRLDDVTVVVTLEPCAMCAGALVNARVARLVFGAADPKAGAAGSRYNLCSDPRLNHEVAVTSGVLEAACASVLSAFFEERR
jgi:tRNA(adenine34) deaminase